MIIKNIEFSINKAKNALENFYNEPKNLLEIQKIVYALVEVYRSNKKVIIFGNGGSCADALHFAEELVGRFKKNRPPLPAISLNDGALLTCIANDYGFDNIYSRGIEAFANEGDYVIGISTSGNSKNIIKALNIAKEKKLSTLALLGKSGGCIKGICEHELIIKEIDTERIQEIHMLILHIIIDELEKILFKDL